MQAPLPKTRYKFTKIQIWCSLIILVPIFGIGAAVGAEMSFWLPQIGIRVIIVAVVAAIEWVGYQRQENRRIQEEGI